MQIVRHSSTNDLLRAPPSMPDVQVAPVTRGTLGDVETVATYWQPSPEELMQLVNGGLVVLYWLGHTMAPVRIEVAQP